MGRARGEPAAQAHRRPERTAAASITVDPVPTDPATPDPARHARRHRLRRPRRPSSCPTRSRHDRGAETCSAGNLRGRRLVPADEAALAARAGRRWRAIGQLRSRHPFVTLFARCSASCSASSASARPASRRSRCGTPPRRSARTPSCSTSDEVAAAVARRDRGRRQPAHRRAPTRARGRTSRSSRAARTDDSPGERNDVTMLVHITDNPRRVTVVSFPRDMLVPIPACPDGSGGSYSAMCVADDQRLVLATAASPCTVTTVEALTGEKIEFAGGDPLDRRHQHVRRDRRCRRLRRGDISDKHTGLSLTAGNHTLAGRRGAAVPAHPPRHRRRLRPRPHLEPAAVHVVDGAQAPVRVGARRTRRRCSTSRPPRDLTRR